MQSVLAKFFFFNGFLEMPTVPSTECVERQADGVATYSLGCTGKGTGWGGLLSYSSNFQTDTVRSSRIHMLFLLSAQVGIQFKLLVIEATLGYSFKEAGRRNPNFLPQLSASCLKGHWVLDAELATVVVGEGRLASADFSGSALAWKQMPCRRLESTSMELLAAATAPVATICYRKASPAPGDTPCFW